MSSLKLSWHSFVPFLYVLLLVPRGQSPARPSALPFLRKLQRATQSSFLQTTTQVSSASFHTWHLPVLLPAWLHSSGHIQACKHHFYTVQTRTAQHSRWNCTNSKCTGRITTFNHMVTKCLILPKMSSALLTARAHFWLMLSHLSPVLTDLFLLSSHLSPSLCLCPAMLFSWCKTTHHFPLMNFTSWLISQRSYLFRSL